MVRRGSTHLVALGFLLVATTLGDWLDAAGSPVISEVCKAETYAAFIGQDKSVLDGLDLPDRTRIIAPNTVVTMDYSPTRLNFILDAKGKIEKIKCG